MSTEGKIPLKIALEKKYVFFVMSLSFMKFYCLSDKMALTFTVILGLLRLCPVKFVSDFLIQKLIFLFRILHL